MSVSWQVLDALQYLHHRGIVHLNVQPDNVVMVSRRRLDVKLIDFGRARRVTSAEGVGVAAEGTAEFMCEYYYLVSRCYVNVRGILPCCRLLRLGL